MKPSLARDDDEDKQQEQHLRGDRQRLQETVTTAGSESPIAFEAGQAGIAIIDENLRCVEMNEVFARINGIPEEEHIGRTIEEVMPDIAPLLEPLILRILDTGQPELNVELHGESTPEPGESRKLTFSLVPLTGTDGRALAVGMLAIEITELKATSSETESAEAIPNEGEFAGQMVGQTEASRVKNRIRVLKEVALALSSAAEILEQARSSGVSVGLDVGLGINFNDEVRRFEVNLIQRALKQTGGNQKKAAGLLRMKHTTLHTKIKRYQI
jgi:PAS domain S-box-containing protein